MGELGSLGRRWQLLFRKALMNKSADGFLIKSGQGWRGKNQGQTVEYRWARIALAKCHMDPYNENEPKTGSAKNKMRHV